MKKMLLLLVLLLMAAEARSDSTMVDTLVAVDTVLFRPGALLTSYNPVTNPENYEKHLYQNPTAALFKSMLIPGLGQIGNRRYIKGAVFFALDTWFVGAAIHYGRQAADFRSKFESDTSVAGRNDYYFLYEDRKDERHKFTWFAVITTFISMFDAYVDAHLSGFPQKTNDDAVSFNLHPSFKGGMVASISLSF